MERERNSAARRAAGELDLARGGGCDARLELVAYDPAWPARFRAEAARLARVLPALEFHHIGSTAVPGLPAKPVIDMMTLVEELDAFVAVLVDRAGYEPPRTTTPR